MTYSRLISTLAFAALPLFITPALAADYHLLLNNNTDDVFNIKKGTADFSNLGANEKMKKIDVDKDDSLIFVSNGIPKFTVTWNNTNDSPNCTDLLTSYQCNFTGLPLSTYNLSISK